MAKELRARPTSCLRAAADRAANLREQAEGEAGLRRVRYRPVDIDSDGDVLVEEDNKRAKSVPAGTAAQAL